MKHAHPDHSHPAAWNAHLDHARFCERCGGRLELRFLAEHGRELKVCQGCGEVHFFNPKVAAGTLVLVDGQVVLLRRSNDPGRGLWTYPGGFVDLGESAQEAARRETLEEVGLEVEIGPPAGVYTSDARDIVIVVFRASVIGGTLCAKGECDEARLFHPSEIPWDVLAFSSTRGLMSETFPDHVPAGWLQRHEHGRAHAERLEQHVRRMDHGHGGG